MAEEQGVALNTQDVLRGQLTQPAPGKLKAPDNIIRSIHTARALYFNCRAEHLPRINLAAQIMGIVAGNPPYDPAELAKYKLSHITNVNNLDARALYERAAQAYWNLLNEAEFIATFEARGSQVNDMPECQQWMDTIARHFDEVIREWESFYTVINVFSAQLVLYGVAPVLWPDERDWRFRSVEYARFFVQDQAQTDIDLLTYVCVETIFTVQYLFDVWEAFHDKPKEDSPWNCEELARFLLFRANQFAGTENQILDMMTLQMKIQNLDQSFNQFYSDEVRLVSLLYREYDANDEGNTISHYMFDRFYVTNDFLFFSDRQYKTMGEALLIFTASPGEVTIHSNRGIGHKIFAPMQALMQLDGNMFDMAKLASTPIIKNNSPGGPKDFETMRVYPGVPMLIGNAELQQNNLGANINQLIQLAQYTVQKTNYNIANAGDDPSMPDKAKGSISAPEVRIKSMREFGVSKNSVAHFYTIFTRLIKNIVVKMLASQKGWPGYEFAKEWKDRCIADGVPELFFKGPFGADGMPKILKVSATQVAGDGSTLARLMGLDEIAPYVGGLGAQGQREYIRQRIMASLGPKSVKAFLPKESADDLRGGASLAQMENVAIGIGESPLFSPDNDQRSHFEVHLAKGNQIIQLIQQQQLTATMADKQFNSLIPHMGQHFQALEQNPLQQGYVDGIRKGWKQLSDYATLNRRNAGKEIEAQIAKQQQAQEKQTAAMSDIQRKDTVAAADIRRKDISLAAKEERSNKDHQTKAELSREKIQSDAENNRLKVILEAKNKSKSEQQSDLEATPLPELRQDLTNINGSTPAPFDIETP